MSLCRWLQDAGGMVCSLGADAHAAFTPSTTSPNYSANFGIYLQRSSGDINKMFGADKVAKAGKDEPAPPSTDVLDSRARLDGSPGTGKRR